jgi:molybdate-binding protein
LAASRRASTYREYGQTETDWSNVAELRPISIVFRRPDSVLGLHFIPLVSERYDLVIRKQHLDLPRMQNLLDTLSRSGFRRELEGLGGYDTRVTSQRVL